MQSNQPTGSGQTSVINRHKKEWQQIAELRQIAHGLMKSGDIEAANDMMAYIDRATRALATQQNSELAIWEKAMGKKAHPMVRLIVQDLVNEATQPIVDEEDDK